VKTTAYEVSGINRYLRMVPKEASDELRSAAQRIADTIAAEAAGKARGLWPAARMVADSVRSRRDRVPVIAMGNQSRLPPHSSGRERRGANQRVYNLMWGAEFGAANYPQFPAWTGNSKGSGYFLWPTVDERSGWMMEQYSLALNRALQVAP
jgi:hypothetical protein